MNVQTLQGGYAGHSSHGSSVNQHAAHPQPGQQPATAQHQAQTSVRISPGATKTATDSTQASKVDDKAKPVTMPEVKGFLDKLFKQIEEMLKKFNPGTTPAPDASKSQTSARGSEAAKKTEPAATTTANDEAKKEQAKPAENTQTTNARTGTTAAKVEPEKVDATPASKVDAQAATKLGDKKTDSETMSLSSILKTGMAFGTSLLSAALGAFNTLMPVVMKLIKP